MASATIPTSIRLSPAEKRRIATAARKRGLSPSAYIKRAALDAAVAKGDDAKLARLERLAASVLEAVEDELDYRAAVAAWNRHVTSGAKPLKPEDVWRDLGI